MSVPFLIPFGVCLNKNMVVVLLMALQCYSQKRPWWFDFGKPQLHSCQGLISIWGWYILLVKQFKDKCMNKQGKKWKPEQQSRQCGHEDHHTNQQDRTEWPGINPYLYDKLISCQGNSVQWKKGSLFNIWLWNNWISTGTEYECGHLCHMQKLI